MQKINQKELRLEKVTKRKRNKLYVKWKGSNNSFKGYNNSIGLVKKS